MFKLLKLLGLMTPTYDQYTSVQAHFSVLISILTRTMMMMIVIMIIMMTIIMSLF